MAKTTIDPRFILTGKDGELYDDLGNFLAQINTFEIQLNIKNVDYRPAGEILDVAVLDGCTATLTFQETVVKDDEFLEDVMTSLKNKIQLSRNFQGVLNGKNGKQTRIVCRNCVPDGSINMAGVKPGDIINRDWTWRINELPDLQSVLTY